MKRTTLKRSLPAIGCTAALMAGSACARTVDSVDLSRYVGHWYQTAAYPQPYEQGLVGVTADYAAQADGSISVYNRGYRDTCGGAVSDIRGSARVIDPRTNAKLEVRFDSVPATQVFPGQYWIVDLDPTGYRWAVVSDGAKQSLFILSRTTRLDPAVNDGIRQRLAANGYDLAKLVDTTPCE